jgi:hypothetical protein
MVIRLRSEERAAENPRVRRSEVEEVENDPRSIAERSTNM